jgi:DNA-binding CsgD family transcriptional regulator
VTATWGLVGRDQDLAAVERLLVVDGASVVVAGAEGAGRSRFAAACLDRAAAAGLNTVRILGTRSASNIPFGAFLGVFDGLGDGPKPLALARTTLLDHAAGARLVLVVDDAHLLDDVSATLVLSLVREPTVAILATVRSGAGAPDGVTALWKDAGARRIELAPLEREQVADLLASVLGAPVASAAVDVLHERSGGAPSVLRELVESAVDAGELREERGVWRLAPSPRVPPRLAEIVVGRLDAIGPAGERLLATLALAEPLATAILDDLGLAGSVAELERQDLVTVDALAAGGEVRLARPVYGQVALERVPDAVRRRILVECADRADAWSTGDDVHFRSVLWRLWSGQQVTQTDLLAAARRAYLLADYERTSELARAAWLTERTVAAGHLLGFALGRTGRSEEAEEVLAVATTLAGSDRDRVLVALARSENLHRGLGDFDGAIAVCRSAEAATVDPAWRDELVAHRAMTLLFHGDLVETLDLVEPIVEPGPERAPRAFAKAAYPAEIALVHAGRADEAMALAAAAFPVHEQVWEDDLFQTEAGVHLLTTLFALTSVGRLGDADALGQAALDLTRGANPAYGFAHVANLVGWNDLQRGRVASARTHFREAIGILVDVRQFAMARWCLAGRAMGAALVGDLADARAAFVEIDQLESPSHQLNRSLVEDARGWMTLVAGEPAGARAIFSMEADRAVATGDHIGAGRLLHSLARCGGAADAVDRLDALATSTAVALVAAQAAFARAVTVGEPTAMVAVAERFAELGADLFAAEAQGAASNAFARRGRARDSSRADRVRRELLDRCEGARTPLTAGTSPEAALSPREREVADLASQRLSSKEISERLAVSPRTVDNHLQRIYQKLGVTGRAGLATLLAEGDEARS